MPKNIIGELAMWILTIFSVAFAIWSFLKSREEKEPHCLFRTYRNIVKLSKEDKLRIIYGEKEVNEVSTTYIFFWNKGKKPILAADIRTPILFVLENNNHNVNLLDYKILKETRLAINFSIEKLENSGDILLDNQTLVAHFDFLDQNDGVVIEVKHSGDVPVYVYCLGTILGVPKKIASAYILNNKLSRNFSMKQLGNSLWEIILAIYIFAIGILPLISFIWIGYNKQDSIFYLISIVIA